MAYQMSRQRPLLSSFRTFIMVRPFEGHPDEGKEDRDRRIFIGGFWRRVQQYDTMHKSRIETNLLPSSVQHQSKVDLVSYKKFDMFEFSHYIKKVRY